MQSSYKSPKTFIEHHFSSAICFPSLGTKVKAF